ncbi:MAG: DUF262 domain-containing protein [Thaumarchaeota archaeon]|nr:DUF262 domain-containing protein [Nitrososphaerota archaeon]
MKATEVPVTKFLQATQAFLIPLYQRTYSWTETQCEQLWDDITYVATKEDVPSHFIGSIVYIEEGLYQVSAVPQLQVIDGQQRLTTLTLLFAALARAIGKEHGSEITSKKIQNYFLFNSEETGDNRYKLILTQSDRDTLQAIMEGRPIPEKYSKNLVNNFEYLQDSIAKSGLDFDTIWRGISKLVMVDIALDAANDKPQLIFESLNSTGLELSQTDLIRNYIMIGLERREQEALYIDFWHPMEEKFEKEPQEFDYFIRDYLTIKTGQIPNIRNVYASFKDYARKQPAAREMVSDIHYFAKFYTRLVFENEPDADLNRKIHDINAQKSDVTYPFLLEAYIDYDRGLISRDEILEIFGIVESYLFRRAICDIPTNSHNKTFASLAGRVEKAQYVESLKAAFCLMTTYRKFPTDVEFTERFVLKDVYNTVRIRKHLLDRLENHDRKERANIGDYTLEHIMPQNENLSQEWREEIGPGWKAVHEKYLHTVGNLTLTGYNPELSDRPFLEKRDMRGGFRDSPIRLNESLTRLERWGQSEILDRGRTLAKKATKVWTYPYLPQEILDKYSRMDEDDDPEDDETPHAPQWESNLVRASVQVKSNIDTLISQIHQKLDCVAEPYSWWLVFYVRKPTERKTMFALLDCGRNTANVAFRIDPSTFQSSENTRKVAGWFFPTGTERRVKLTTETTPEIMDNLAHAYDSTLRALDTRRDR